MDRSKKELLKSYKQFIRRVERENDIIGRSRDRKYYWQNKSKILASAIAKVEGHKSQARIGDIREILSILAYMSYKSPDPLQAIISLGIARAKRKKPSKIESKL